MDDNTAMTIRDYILACEQRFQREQLWFGHGTTEAMDDAAWLVAGALGIPSDKLNDVLDRRLSHTEKSKLDKLVDQRVNNRIPVAYLLNEAWFAGHRYYVDKRVLIPRSLIGEYIEERFQPWIPQNRVRRVLDLCTGCGCIAIAIALEFPDVQIDAVDVSEDALAVAHQNVESYMLADRIKVIHSDIFSALNGQRYDLIVCNPPYVPADSMNKLPGEYNHEPNIALAAGDQGLQIISRILHEASTHLEAGGLLIMEVGESRQALEHCYAHTAFTWLAHKSGNEAVFLLAREELPNVKPCQAL